MGGGVRRLMWGERLGGCCGGHGLGRCCGVRWLVWGEGVNG